MNAPSKITAADVAPSDWYARLDRAADYTRRAKAIVDRVMPRLPSVNGYTDPIGFIEAAQHDHQRSLLYWRTYARLRAKAEGGAPYLSMPKHCSAVSGGAMEQVARELEAVS